MMTNLMLTAAMMAATTGQLGAQLTPEALYEEVLQIVAGKPAAGRAAASDWRPMVSLELQMDGSAGGNAFHGAGRLYLIPGQLMRMEDAALRSDVNQVEILLVDQRGMFTYATHTYLLRRLGAMTDLMVDLSEVKLSGNASSGTIELIPVKQLVPFAAGRNSFYTSMENAGAAYQISEGSVKIHITNTGELSGSVEVRGVNVGTGLMESYSATFTGKPEAIGIFDPSQAHTIRSLPAGAPSTPGVKR